ncbi:MAG: trimethylamine methyltransferase family protein [Eubacterium sp.]
MKLSYSFGTQSECDQIHETSLSLLEKTGVIIASEAARNLLIHHGARCDGSTVFIPPNLIEKALEFAPSSFTLQTPRHRTTIGNGKLCHLPSYGAIYVSKNGNVTTGTRHDFVNFSKLNHENKSLALSCPYTIEPADIPIDIRENYKLATSLKYSDKPTYSMTQNGATSQKSIAFTRRFFGIEDAYILIGNINISAPLLMSKGTADTILVHATENQPLMIACGSGLSGLTAPPTPAANILLSNTAILAGITLAQLASPGLPVIYGFPLFAVNSRNATISCGSPITALFTMAGAAMGKYYHLPVRSGGVFTDAKTLDYQSGLESSLNLFSCLFSEVDLMMHTFGMENSLNTLNYNKYILDQALLDYMNRYLKGFDINPVTLMANEIERVGPDGNYIGVRNLRLIRKQYPIWPFDGLNESDILQKTQTLITMHLDAYVKPDYDNEQYAMLKQLLPAEFLD